MDLYEYQTRELLEAHGVPVSAGIAASTPQEAESATRELGGDLVVVKAQIKTDGRGKAGGVKLARSPQEAADKAEETLNMDIEDHKVHRVLVTSGVGITREPYFSILPDRSRRRYLAICSVDGGMNVETLAKERSEALAKVAVDPDVGINKAKAREIASATGFDAETGEKAAPVLPRLWDVYSEGDATLVEVNPLVLTEQSEAVALDGKVTLDDNTRFRHSGYEALVDETAEDPLKTKAKTLGLNYVRLGGQAGVIDNGAGLVMSTLDVATYAGEEYGVGPVSFLDIGDGADANVMSSGLIAVLEGPDVRSVFINAFGGITACDEVAKEIITALDVLGEATSKSIVTYLDGNTIAEGRAILTQVNHPLITLVDAIGGAAAKAARLATELDAK